ncbi:MAG: DUF354 domain-containing protein [Syntrophaceae bacterium]|nr:DUF354 domain-containing protein [Syntrophaceae bacterium]
MKILLEINHPGQVHLLRHIYFELIRKEHFVIVITKKDHMINNLLSIYKIPYILLGSKGKGIQGKIFKQLLFDYKAYKLVKKNKIEIGLGSSITNDHVSFLTSMKSIHLSDDDEDVVPFITKYSYPFSEIILSPDCLVFKKYKNKNIGYPGYHELAYLHPKRFTPDEEVLHEAGVNPGEKYFVMRFNSFIAHHDIGAQGLSLENKRQLIDLLSPHGKVFITTEKEIDQEFKRYQLTVSPEKVHSLLYYATMFIGDSQTMTSEAAVLGTPAIRSNSFVGRISYLEEEENKYGLTFGFTPNKTEAMFEKIGELLTFPQIKEEWQRRRQVMLQNKIDVTAFIVWFLENYPSSIARIKQDPKIFNEFK